MKNVTIFGVTTPDPTKQFRSLFKELWQNDEVWLFESKETFHQDDMNFDYKLVVRFEDYAFWSGEKTLSCDLLLVPTFLSLHESHKKSILDSTGIPVEECNLHDVINNGCYVCLASETYHYKRMGTWENCMKIKEWKKAVANVVETINDMRGFWLDKQQNKIGNDGWDLLNDWVNGESYIKVGLDRMQEAMGEKK